METNVIHTSHIFPTRMYCGLFFFSPLEKFTGKNHETRYCDARTHARTQAYEVQKLTHTPTAPRRDSRTRRASTASASFSRGARGEGRTQVAQFSLSHHKVVSIDLITGTTQHQRQFPPLTPETLFRGRDGAQERQRDTWSEIEIQLCGRPRPHLFIATLGRLRGHERGHVNRGKS